MPTHSAQPVDTVARTYAKALFELADKHSQLEAVEADLQALAELWNSNADLQRLMSSRVITTEQRAGMVERLFHGKLNDLAYRFVQVLTGNDRGDKLAMVAEAYDDLMDAKFNRLDVDAFVATPLEDDKLETVRSQLSKALEKDVQLTQHTDASLIGGIKLRIGDQLIDGSVAAQLRKMRERMVEAGEAAKQRVLEKGATGRGAEGG